MERKILRVVRRAIYSTGIDNEGTVYYRNSDAFQPLFHDSSNFSLFEALRRKYARLLTFYSRERLPIYIYTNFNLALACRPTTTCLHEFTAISPGRLPSVLRPSISCRRMEHLRNSFPLTTISASFNPTLVERERSVVSILAFKFSLHCETIHEKIVMSI